MTFYLLFSIMIRRLYSLNNGAACLTVSNGNQAIALCIDARLSDDVSLCASRKIFHCALNHQIYVLEEFGEGGNFERANPFISLLSSPPHWTNPPMSTTGQPSSSPDCGRILQTASYDNFSGKFGT